MTARGNPSILVLRWVLGLVILIESTRFAFSHSAALVFAKTGLPTFLRMALAWAEIAAAVLFLVPGFVKTGGRFLIAVLAAAIVIHLLHGWFDVGGLVVYIAATWAVMETS
jgi:hypothetical protein